jgi:hypothetical protein
MTERPATFDRDSFAMLMALLSGVIFGAAGASIMLGPTLTCGGWQSDLEAKKPKLERAALPNWRERE